MARDRSLAHKAQYVCVLRAINEDPFTYAELVKNSKDESRVQYESLYSHMQHLTAAKNESRVLLENLYSHMQQLTNRIDLITSAASGSASHAQTKAAPDLPEQSLSLAI